MNLIFRQTLRLLCIAAALCTCACNSLVHDDTTECPEGMVIQLVPKYAPRTSFEAEMTDVHIFIFDENFSQVKKLEVSERELADQNYQVSVNIDPGKYNIVVWNGISDTDNYSENNAAVALLTDNNCTNNILAPLWHGKADNVEVESLTMETVTVPMVKDTNNFVIYLCSTNGSVLDPDDFQFQIVSENALYDRDNNVLESPQITYREFSCSEEFIEGSINADLAQPDELGNLQMVRGDINTLRLTLEHPSYLSIVSKSNNKTILTFNLNDYVLKAFRALNAESSVSSQQYLDTEDFFNITVFLTPQRNNENAESEGITYYYASVLKIGYWVLRLQSASL